MSLKDSIGTNSTKLESKYSDGNGMPTKVTPYKAGANTGHMKLQESMYKIKMKLGKQKKTHKGKLVVAD